MTGPTYVAESAYVLNFVGPDLEEALLVSAYDLHHDLLLDGNRLLSSDYHQTYYASPALLIIDSGGYELAEDFESGEVNRGPRVRRGFTEVDYAAVVDRLSPDLDILMVNFDEPLSSRGGYHQQREHAQAFFSSRPQFKSDFLLKPARGSAYIDCRQLGPEVRNLRAFDVIGVTEKELGRSLLDRLVTLGRLRHLMDDEGVRAPIHVFGALDPLLTPLYFMVGGEIFDGLSWIRYAYHNGLAVHQDALTVLLGNIDDDPQRRDAKRHISNISELKKLKHSLERWVHEPDRYDVLGRQHAQLRDIFETVNARLSRKG